MDEEPSLAVLLEACLRLGTDPHFDPHELWTLFANHSFFQQSLIKAVQRYCRREPSVEFDDMMQEVSLLFGQKVLRGTSLRLDRERAGRTFGAWWRKVIENSVREAGRRLRIVHKATSLETMPDTIAALEEWNAWFRHPDVQDAMSRLRCERVEVVDLWLLGCDPEEISEITGLTDESITAIHKTALVCLKRELRDYR